MVGIEQHLIARIVAPYFFRDIERHLGHSAFAVAQVVAVAKALPADGSRVGGDGGGAEVGGSDIFVQGGLNHRRRVVGVVGVVISHLVFVGGAGSQMFQGGAGGRTAGLDRPFVAEVIVVDKEVIEHEVELVVAVEVAYGDVALLSAVGAQVGDVFLVSVGGLGLGHQCDDPALQVSVCADEIALAASGRGGQVDGEMLPVVIFVLPLQPHLQRAAQIELL